MLIPHGDFGGPLSSKDRLKRDLDLTQSLSIGFSVRFSLALKALVRKCSKDITLQVNEVKSFNSQAPCVILSEFFIFIFVIAAVILVFTYECAVLRKDLSK